MSTNAYTPLAGRVAVVTGASSGIGEATATLLAARGAKVALLARRTDRLAVLAQQIKEAGGEALAVEVDVTSTESVNAAAKRVTETFGEADLLVNSAGIMLPAPIEERRLTEWESQIDINVTGALRAINAFLPGLQTAATQGRPADLVNISSVAAQVLFPSFAVYAASKAAITQLSNTMRAELGPKGIRVSAIEPGLVTTELQGHVTDPGAKAWLDDAQANIEFLRAEDIAELIAFTTSQPKRVNLAQIAIYATEQS